MVTVIEAFDVDGERLGRCDARCHTAKGAKCTCICGGINHGKGVDYVVQDFTAKGLHLDPDITYVTRPQQSVLFTPEDEKKSSG